MIWRVRYFHSPLARVESIGNEAQDIQKPGRRVGAFSEGAQQDAPHDNTDQVADELDWRGRWGKRKES